MPESYAAFLGGGSLPLRGYVLRPSALRAYAATPSSHPHPSPTARTNVTPPWRILPLYGITSAEFFVQIYQTQGNALPPILFSQDFFLHVDTYHKTNVDIPLYGACLPLGRSLSWQPSKMRAPQNRGMEMPGWAMSWARYGLARMREQDAREEG